MPIVAHETYCALLDKALAEHYALPAINALQVDTLNAAIEGFAEAQSDGIIQITPSAGECTSGNLHDAYLGAITLAEHARRIADRYDVNIAIHSDHCPTSRLDEFLKPLIAETARRRAAGDPNLFNSHMYDGSDIALDENLVHAVELAKQCRDNELVLEVEVGVFGGAEDTGGDSGQGGEKLYTTPQDMLKVCETMSQVDGAQLMLAPAFGNVHGFYKPGEVVLKPAILKEGQDAVTAKHGHAARFRLVFHGGSGSTIEEIHESIDYGVVKFNIHTDTQYAFTRAVAGHMMRNYDGVLRIDGEVGRKPDYLASTWLKTGRAGMAQRVIQACHELKSAGKSMR